MQKPHQHYPQLAIQIPPPKTLPQTPNCQCYREAPSLLLWFCGLQAIEGINRQDLDGRNITVNEVQSRGSGGLRSGNDDVYGGGQREGGEGGYNLGYGCGGDGGYGGGAGGLQA
ncbi:Cinnamyl-alcohol dehydrogenase Flavonol reductase/cinnamoyl-CoA reductase [Dionaea muscipula]